MPSRPASFPNSTALGLIGLAVACFIVGGASPVAAKLSNPFFGYGIIFFSLPAWALGALAGGVLALLSSRRRPRDRLSLRWGLALALGNLIAAFSVLLVPFHAS